MAITKDMKIQEIISRYPETIPVFERYGINCVGCLASEFEDLEAGASFHRVRIGELLRDLNAAQRRN